MRIWFNHWFSTAYHFIEMLRADNHYIIATNSRESCVYKTNADEFYIEPTFNNDEDYLKYCLSFCIEHNIEIFFIKRGMNIIIQHIDKFKQLDTHIVCETNIELFNLLQDKYKTYKFFKTFPSINIPTTKICTNSIEFKQAYYELKETYPRICMKYNQDEGALSFKEIDTKSPNISRISSDNTNLLSYDYLYKCLNSVSKFRPILVMPYLDGVEISIDCLQLKDQFIAITREKLPNHVNKISKNKEYYDLAKKIQDKIQLNAPYNIQFRYDASGTLYLLEINTRLAGGAWKDKYMDIQFPNLYIQNLFNKNTPLIEYNNQTVTLRTIETSVVLN